MRAAARAAEEDRWVRDRLARERLEQQTGQPRDPPGVHVLFVLVLPFLCFGVDALIWGPVSHASPLGAWAMAIFGAVAYFASFATGRSRAWSLFLRGVLGSAAAAAILIGVLLLPLSIITTIAGIGLLGFVPFVTGGYLVARMSTLPSPSGDRASRDRLLVLAGFVAPVVLATAIDSVERRWLAVRQASLQSEDSAVVLNALRDLAKYPLCFGRCSSMVCKVRENRVLATPEARPFVSRIFRQVEVKSPCWYLGD